MKKFLILSLLLLAGCASRQNSSDQIVSIQLIDRNGFSETISNKDRLENYQKVDFLSAQPYQKVLRVFGRDQEGRSHSQITSYHKNGQALQYLEAIDGRAHGLYCEWHENGKLRIEAHVIEGMADLGEVAQASWIFSGPCQVWDEEGFLQASFSYDKGALQGEARYYHPNGQLAKVIPYDKGAIDGDYCCYNPQGELIEFIPYTKGQKEGKAYCLWSKNQHKYMEQYVGDRLISGHYWTPQGELLAQVELGNGKQALFQGDKLSMLIDYKEGMPEGLVRTYNADGVLLSSYSWKEGKKEGEEWEYYTTKSPKLLLNWQGDCIQGVVKTWYENGKLESQREMSNNKKHGLSFAYYKNGDLMLMEEYESDKLMKGSYYQKGEKSPVTKIDSGQGIATLYDGEGHFSRKVSYEHGRPVMD